MAARFCSFASPLTPISVTLNIPEELSTFSGPSKRNARHASQASDRGNSPSLLHWGFTAELLQYQKVCMKRKRQKHTRELLLFLGGINPLVIV